VTTPVSLALKADGIEQVREAIRSVKHSFIEMDQATLASSDAASKKRIATMRAEGQIKLALLHEEADARSRAEDARAKSAAKYNETIRRRNTWFGGGNDAGSTGNQAAAAFGVAFAGMTAAINLASASLKQFASYVINDVIKPGLALQTRAQQVANNSMGQLTASGVMSRSKAIGLRNNMDPAAVLDAAGRFQDLTGEPGIGMDVMNTVATISKGRGYDPKALSELAAATYKPGMKAEDLTQMLLTLTGQGEKGSIPIGELARLGGRLTAPAQKMGGSTFTQVTTANALLQTAKRTGFGTVDEAAEGLNKFVEGGLLHGKSLSQRSFATVNGTEQMIDPVAYLQDVYRKTHLDSKKLHGLGFSEPEAKFVQAYGSTASEAFKTAKGGGATDAEAYEAGAKAIGEMVNGMKTATSTMEEEEKRRNAVVETAGQSLQHSFDAIAGGLLEQSMPMVQKLADDLAAHVPEITAGALALISAFSAIVDAALQLSDYLAQQFGAEGDTIKHVKDTGQGTAALPQINKSGYWKQSDGYYSFVMGSGDEQADTQGKGLTKRESAWGRGVYTVDADDAKKGLGPATKDRDVYTEVNGKEVTPEQEAAGALTPGSREAQEAAVQANHKVAKSAHAAADALERLKDTAGRTKPFKDN